MWIAHFLIILGWISTTKAMSCENVFNECQKDISWIRCYDNSIRTCTQGRRTIPDFFKNMVNSTKEVAVSASSTHRVRIPSSALRKSSGSELETEVQVLATVISSSYFKNPEISVDEANDKNLSYITYVGSALSFIFAVISLIIYICVQRRRPEKAIGVHMHLTVALLCLHLSFLLCSFWVWKLKEVEEGLVCQVLGLVLHWSLLATFCWTALEGFHLYLLLVRVFNIYVSKYLLKLCLVGWGLPTLIAVICGITGVYGKYNLELINDKNQNLTASICWMSSQFPQRRVVSYITTVAFPCLVIIYNSCMLGLVLFKLWGMRGDNSWKKTNKQKGGRLWKDCVTVLGLSCVLGLPWGLTSATYMSLTGIYVFTILNSLQGVFMFLWSLALTRKSRTEDSSSVRSGQKMMTTSFNS